MTRKEELEKVKEIIKVTIDDYSCGLYSTRNVVGDCMETMFNGKYFTLDACYNWSYYELFGTTEDEFKEIKDYYNKLGGLQK